MTAAWARAVSECSVAGCGKSAESVTIWTGRRCKAHRPRYQPSVATRLAADGWPDTAAAYGRTFGRTS